MQVAILRAWNAVIHYFCVTISILWLKKIRLYFLIIHPQLVRRPPQLITESSHLLCRTLNRIPFYVLKPQSPPHSATLITVFAPSSIFPNFFLTPFPSHNSHSRMAEQRGTSVPSLLANDETTPSAHCRLSFASANFRFLCAIFTIIPSSSALRCVVRANPSNALAEWRMQTSWEKIKETLCSSGGEFPGGLVRSGILIRG